MSIEDVEYLYENSEKDSFILYCDSSLRDRRLFPHPSAYTVYFDQPFRHVYSVEILDGDIPSVMYNIDDNTNGIGGFTYDFSPTATTDTVQSLLTELSNFDVFDGVMNSTKIVSILPGGAISFETGIVFVSTFDLIASYMASLANTNNTDPQIGDYAQAETGYFVFERGIIASAVMFDKAQALVFDFPVFEFTYGGSTYQVIDDADNATYQELIYIVRNFEVIVTQNPDKTFNLIYYRITEVPKSFVVNLRNQNNIMYLMDMRFFYVSITAGNYEVLSVLKQVQNGALASVGILTNTLNSADPTIQPVITFTSASGFVLNMRISTANTTMGFDQHADVNETKKYVRYAYRDNHQLFGGVYDSNTGNWNIIAPGVIYLLGVRYVILRCPEVEGHMYGSRAFGNWSPGLGMFKLFAVNDIAHQRFDYVNFSKKPFHPIGKLDRLSFRFEMTDGTLYDFKGANHLMLICIRYLVPTQKHKFVRSELAPNYDKSFHQYLPRHIEDHEKKEPEESTDLSTIKKRYQDAQNKYDYSSSDDGTGSSEGGDERDYRKVVRM
jgi:hypothetical protein